MRSRIVIQISGPRGGWFESTDPDQSKSQIQAGSVFPSDRRRTADLRRLRFFALPLPGLSPQAMPRVGAWAAAAATDTAGALRAPRRDVRHLPAQEVRRPQKHAGWSAHRACVGLAFFTQMRRCLRLLRAGQFPLGSRRRVPSHGCRHQTDRLPALRAESPGPDCTRTSVLGSLGLHRGS